MTIRAATALLFLACCAHASAATQQSGTQLTIAPGGFATVEGRVLANERGCAHDLACYLRLAWRGEELRVYYHDGEWPACVASQATRQGDAVVAGDRIKAFGLYRRMRDVHVIDVCTSPRATLVILPREK